MPESIFFESLFSKANEALASHQGLEQTLAVRTSAGNIYLLLNEDVFSLDKQAEKQFLEMLSERGDTVLTHIIALWRNCRTDFPSFHFRNQLALMHTDNLDAQIIVRDENGYRTIILRDTITPGDTL